MPLTLRPSKYGHGEFQSGGDRRAYDAALITFCFNVALNIDWGNVLGAVLLTAIVAYLLRNSSPFR